ncbi:MAG: WD40/YVTN/BNR-like repeat-containing protein [Acidimicrobiales bacterium]
MSVPKGAQRLSAVACSDAIDCVAVGIGTLIYSSDGGVSWNLATPPISQTLFLGASCTSALRCIAVGMRPRPAQPDGGVLLETTNAGKTWTNASYPKLTPGIGSVSCPSANTCIAVGGTVLVSNDAGSTWRIKAIPDGIQPLSSISCSTATTCVAIGPNTQGQTNPSLSAVAIATSNAGASFQHLSLPPGSAYAVSVSCVANTCNALGADPTGKSSTVGFWSANSGMTWSTSSPYPTIAQLRGLICMSATSCIAVGRTNTNAIAYVSTSNASWVKAVLP